MTMTARTTAPARFFIIFSLSRCGSTAIHRALNAHRDITCLFEPDFSAAAWDPVAVRATVGRLRGICSGIKHVWDPSGFPFVTDHVSSIDTLEANYERVLAANAAILAQASAVVFLRRRNQLARIVSDLLGQQTDLWGIANPDGTLSPDINEPETYRRELSARRITALDADVVDWYLTHAPVLERTLRECVGTADCIDLWYEDLFGRAVRADERIRRYLDILEFIGVASDESAWTRSVVTTVFRPSGKLNDASTLRLIPNLAQIQERFPGLTVE